MLPILEVYVSILLSVDNLATKNKMLQILGCYILYTNLGSLSLLINSNVTMMSNTVICFNGYTTLSKRPVMVDPEIHTSYPQSNTLTYNATVQG